MCITNTQSHKGKKKLTKKRNYFNKTTVIKA